MENIQDADIIIVVEGGVVQSVYARDSSLNVYVADYDNESNDTPRNFSLFKRAMEKAVALLRLVW